ncbi:NDUBB dehydrogenase, partial [Urocynchramus pylzowi]|nr:NDUBB dehydrogenase [Urocynchramus pylzowi]
QRVWDVPRVRGSPICPLPRRLQQWARREAEILVRERERRGLPLLTSNYYDPKRLPLPPPE